MRHCTYFCVCTQIVRQGFLFTSIRNTFIPTQYHFFMIWHSQPWQRCSVSKASIKGPSRSCNSALSSIPGCCKGGRKKFREKNTSLIFRVHISGSDAIELLLCNFGGRCSIRRSGKFRMRHMSKIFDVSEKRTWRLLFMSISPKLWMNEPKIWTCKTRNVS